MTTTHLLRGGAIVLAIAGLVDPSWSTSRKVPVPVDIRMREDGGAAARAVRARLESDFGAEIRLDSSDEPAAIVSIGETSVVAAARDGIPISTIALAAPAEPNIRVASAEDPDPVPVGWAATFRATIDGRGVKGRTSRIVLEERGAEVAHVDHKWTADRERFEATLTYTPPAPGTSVVTLRARPTEGETSTSDSAVDFRLVATGRRLKVLVHEPRPSWNATFVRRGIEQDPSFDVSTRVQASKGLEVRAGQPPPSLTSAALDPFDVVVVGAPEELRAAEVNALRDFTRKRGGTIVLMPDRRPSGPYLELMTSAAFDEVLVEKPIELQSAAGAILRSSEMAVQRSAVAGAETLAAFDQGKGAKAVVVEYPSGAGRVIFSGAMDAWRFRASTDDGFDRFWRARIAEAALAAPSRLQVSLVPSVPRPGENVMVRVRIRRTEWQEAAGRAVLPAARARLVATDGRDEPVRLWPATQPGVLEGHFVAPAVGTYDLAIHAGDVPAGGTATIDEVVQVVAQPNRAAGDAEDTAAALKAISAVTGGVAVDATDLAPLGRYLRELPRPTAARPVHPTRSLGFVMAFAALLCGEWLLRRRNGLQ